ncbi:MAG: DUF6249 domain-containing protein [Pseudomonadota bacterium]
MPAEITPIVMGIAFLLAVVYIVRTLSNNRTRREIAKTSADSEAIQKLLLENAVPDYEKAFRNGLLVFALGLAFTVVALADYGPGDAMTYALLLLFAGGSQLLYYWLRKEQV